MAFKHVWNIGVRFPAILPRPNLHSKAILIGFCTVRDKNFDYFRNNENYKTSVVPQAIDIDKYKIAGPGFSFVLDKDETNGEIFSHLKLRENVMKLSNDQVKDILCLLANMKIDSSLYPSMLKYLDEKCALSAERWSIDLSLFMMDAWFLILGPKAFRKHYFSAVTSLWSRKVNRCSKNHIIQMLYYIGLSKSPVPFILEGIEDRMDTFANDLSDEEWAIALISFFKTSTRISSRKILSKSCGVAERFLLNDNRFQLISILKCLRHAQFYDDRLWDLLKDYVIKHLKDFNFVECTNFLAAFAAQNIYDRNIYKSLEIEGVKLLTDEDQQYGTISKSDPHLHPSIKSRVKDFARFLWALNCMGHTMENENLIKICDLLKTLIDRNEFQKHPYILVDCAQSLALSGCYPQAVLNNILNPEFFKDIEYMLRDKPKYQFYFVQKCILIECPDMKLPKASYALLKQSFHPIPKNMTKEIAERTGFDCLIDILKQNLPPNSYRCCYIVPHIMIAGIFIHVKQRDVILLHERNPSENFEKFVEMNVISYNISDWVKNRCGSYVCVEILDPSVCSCNSTEPVGLMKTKIRQLQKMLFNVVVLSPEEIIDISKMAKSEQSSKILSILRN